MAAKTQRAPNGCLEWTAQRDRDGYGVISVVDTDGRWVPHRAHRIAYLLAHPDQSVPPVVRHTCDNPSCVDPAHLLPGTHADNAADSTARNRRPYGDHHPRTAISDADVAALRADAADGVPRNVLRTRYGLSKSQVQRIVTGQARTRPA